MLTESTSKDYDQLKYRHSLDSDLALLFFGGLTWSKMFAKQTISVLTSMKRVKCCNSNNAINNTYLEDGMLGDLPDCLL